MRYVVHSAAGREIDICLAIWLSALSIVYVECIGWVHAISGREPATSTGFSARSTSRINPAIAPSLYRPGRAGHWSSSHCVLYNHKLRTAYLRRPRRLWNNSVCPSQSHQTMRVDACNV